MELFVDFVKFFKTALHLQIFKDSGKSMLKNGQKWG